MNQLRIHGKTATNGRHTYGRRSARLSPVTRQRQCAGRGYTGHEHFTDFALVNMNARLFDPLVARFLNPDPLIQSPDVPQNANRYTYCFNNPLRYIDPTGMWGIDDPDDPVYLDEIVCVYNVKKKTYSAWSVNQNTNNDRGDNALNNRFTGSSTLEGSEGSDLRNNISGTGGGSGGGRTVTSSQTPPHHINPAPVSDKVNRSTTDKVKDAIVYSNDIIGSAMNTQNGLIWLLVGSEIFDVTLELFKTIGLFSSILQTTMGLVDLCNILSTWIATGEVNWSDVAKALGDTGIGLFGCFVKNNAWFALGSVAYFVISEIYFNYYLKNRRK